MPKPRAMPSLPDKPAADLNRTEILDIFTRARDGDKAALGKVKAVLDAQPALLRGTFDTLDRSIEARYLDAMVAPTDGLGREIYRRQLAAMRTDLEGERPTPLERLLVARVVACWLQVQHADSVMAGMEAGNHKLAQGEYARQRQDRAHVRHLQAIKVLAQVRRLQLPVMQINIGAQQLNVATDSQPNDPGRAG